MKSGRKEHVGSILPEAHQFGGDSATTWEMDDTNDPWKLEAWDEEQVRMEDQRQVTFDSGGASTYYDYVADRRHSTLPYDQKGIAELYVEDLEFSPTHFGEYDDTEEFAN